LTLKGEYFIDHQNLSELMCIPEERINVLQKVRYWLGIERVFWLREWHLEVIRNVYFIDVYRGHVASY